MKTFLVEYVSCIDASRRTYGKVKAETAKAAIKEVRDILVSMRAYKGMGFKLEATEI